MSSNQIKGTVFAIISATFWGLSGVFGQFLFQQRSFSPEWLVTIRLLVPGLLLLMIAYTQKGKQIFLIFSDLKAIISLLLFSIFGMLAAQLTFFMAIKHSNAATATVLLFLNPVFILLVVSLQQKKCPSLLHFVAVIFALTGSFFMVTHGNVHSLSISTEAFWWGISSALAVTFYTLYPSKLIKKWHTSIIIGWAMFIGGILLSFFYPPWHIKGVWDIYALAATIFVVIFGSLITFYLYLVSVQYIGGSKVSLLSSTEPLAAALFSVLLLNMSFGALDWFGMICIMLAVILLSKSK
ncbi:DMT family transporter [Neisseria sp. Ec49-e6-T10]|uniref:DMT family transporter n=1 Tax=Neisseria sp. Ec49-e6-T10 TaxID=3140744 RepID=UPI003EC0C80E